MLPFATMKSTFWPPAAVDVPRSAAASSRYMCPSFAIATTIFDGVAPGSSTYSGLTEPKSASALSIGSSWSDRRDPRASPSR